MINHFQNHHYQRTAPIASIDEVENEFVPADAEWVQPDDDHSTLSADANKMETNSDQRLELMSILEPEEINTDKLTPIVFGHFATLSGPFVPGSVSSRKRFAKNVLFCVSFILLTVRAIWYIKMLGTSPNLSLEWARNSLQLSISLNALSILYWFRTGGTEYLNEFGTALSRTLRQNRMPNIPRCSRISSYILASICIVTCLIWAFRQTLQMEMRKRVNYTEPFVAQLLRENQYSSADILILSDALAAIYAGFISAVALCLFYLSFQSVLAEWTIFKRAHFDGAIETGSISNANVLTELCNSMLPMLRFAHFTSNKLEQLGMNIFMTAVFCSISSSFISSGGGRPKSASTNWPLFDIVDSFNNGAWAIFSIILLFNIIKGPYDVHSKIREIKEELLLTDSIWNSNDQTLIAHTKIAIMRIMGTRIHRIGSQLFNLIFVAQIVFVYLLVSGSNCSQQAHPNVPNNDIMI